MAASSYLDLMWIPALDFFAVPVFLSGLLLSRRAPFGAVVIGSALIAALLLLKPRDPWLSQMVAQLGIYHFMVRPIVLMLIVAIASWLWGRSVEQAIMRADRAEEVAAMEHQLADQKRQLDRGIQNLLETHVRASNGDFSARAATNQDNVLWQIAVSLNNLLSRLGKYSHVDQRLGRTEAEIDRVAMAMETARAGRQPSWPTPSGTRVDRLLALLTGQPQPRQMPMQDRSAIAAYQMPPSQAARPAHAYAPRPADSKHTGAITGQWREVTGRHADYSASAGERQTDQLRSAPWGRPQPGFGSGNPTPGPEASNPAAGFWPETSRQSWSEERPRAADQTARWGVDPLPPLGPSADVIQADLRAQTTAPSQAGGSPWPAGGTFSESFPGQLRDGASWEDLRDLSDLTSQTGLGDAASSGPSGSTAPSAPNAPVDTNNWPDWPSFLRNLDAQTGD
jgi:hypothetical protein